MDRGGRVPRTRSSNRLPLFYCLCKLTRSPRSYTTLRAPLFSTRLVPVVEDPNFDSPPSFETRFKFRPNAVAAMLLASRKGFQDSWIFNAVRFFSLPSNERSPCLASRSEETSLPSAFYARERDAFASLRRGIYLEKTGEPRGSISDLHRLRFPSKIVARHDCPS